ncbi:uncharacterized protein LY79DRAFT_570707 [Colletotrichum navitas]|uniref:Uncharacterized protein n=1 Tax=Colletotrichum navitas TaxID=681940 RepID=A0AAD8PLT2_9PEZI|nr:uncharacterized protein LY79DRAFT_570707 [Colletotrichum navitas]KAK1569961.1 hypothetical protein LY79DRAFT_570707 [Colletotrichum navitas]
MSIPLVFEHNRVFPMSLSRHCTPGASRCSASQAIHPPIRTRPPQIAARLQRDGSIPSLPSKQISHSAPKPTLSALGRFGCFGQRDGSDTALVWPGWPVSNVPFRYICHPPRLSHSKPLSRSPPFPPSFLPDRVVSDSVESLSLQTALFSPRPRRPWFPGS